ncbi:hypothetical protein X777_08966 [Ooceraea biroi]|uniref:Uncharacterized protein n=1 Tax=Ooceraea biroi TaxID=2015173 RepID=A0A026W9E5_OOCBI|nr:hypothetical protein X777_08966 [Ooceraea biroi]
MDSLVNPNTSISEEMLELLGEDPTATKEIAVKFHPELKCRWDKWMSKSKQSGKRVLHSRPRRNLQKDLPRNHVFRETCDTHLRNTSRWGDIRDKQQSDSRPGTNERVRAHKRPRVRSRARNRRRSKRGKSSSRSPSVIYRSVDKDHN